MTKENLKSTVVFGLVVAAIILFAQFGIGKIKHSYQVAYGAVGGLLIENYDPYVMNNGGINSALPFQTSSTLTVAGITNTGTFTQSGALVASSTVTQGGGVTASSSVQTTALLLPTDFDTENVIDFVFNGAVAGGTVQLPASTTLPLSANPGSMRTIWIRNATTTAATAVIVTGNTGTLFKVASSTNQIGTGGGAQQIYGDTDGSNVGRIDLLRKANSDIIATFTFFRDN